MKIPTGALQGRIGEEQEARYFKEEKPVFSFNSFGVKALIGVAENFWTRRPHSKLLSARAASTMFFFFLYSNLPVKEPGKKIGGALIANSETEKVLAG